MSRTMSDNVRSQYFNNNYELRDKQNTFVGWYRYDAAGHVRFLPAPGLSIHNAVVESLNLAHNNGYNVVLTFNGVSVDVPYAKTVIGNDRHAVMRDIIALYFQNVNTTQRG